MVHVRLRAVHILAGSLNVTLGRQQLGVALFQLPLQPADLLQVLLLRRFGLLQNTALPVRGPGQSAISVTSYACLPHAHTYAHASQ